MTFEDFIKENDGKGIDWDGAYSTQCMDLAHAYASQVVGADFPAAPAAKDVWSKGAPKGYDKIANTPDGVPQKGDIIIWGTEVGAYGHIAVFIEGNASTFTSFDQNWPVNSLCHKQSHSYKGVLGWLHPQKLPTDTHADGLTKMLNWDEISAYCKVDKLDKNGAKIIITQIEALRRSLAEKEATIQARTAERDQAVLAVCPNPSVHTNQPSSPEPTSPHNGVPELPSDPNSGNTGNLPPTPVGVQTNPLQGLIDFIKSLFGK